MVTEDRCQNPNVLQLRSRSVCRALWGPVDHDQVRKDLEREQKTISKALTRKYNFDFESGKPMKGKWQWETTQERDRSTPKPRPIPSPKRRKVAASAEDPKGTSNATTNCSQETENMPVDASQTSMPKVGRRRTSRKQTKSSQTQSKKATASASTRPTTTRF